MKLHGQYILTHDQKKIFLQTSFEPNAVPHEKFLMFNYGLVCSTHHWSKQIDFFIEQGFNLIFHDYRGHFNSSGEEDLESITFKNIADDMKEILDHLQIKQCIMLGHSMGVNTTLEFAKFYPEYLQGMVLIGGTVMPVTEVMLGSNIMDIVLPYVQLLYEKYPKEGNWIWKTSAFNPLIQQMIKQGGFNTAKVSNEFIQIYLNRIGQLHPRIFFQLFKEMTYHDVSTYLEKIKTKALIIGGENDKVIPPYLQQMLKNKLPNSELYMIFQGSHVPQVDFPEQINQRILLFANDAMATQSSYTP